MSKSISINTYREKSKKRGLSAKNKISKNKKSKLYKKAYRGQGR